MNFKQYVNKSLNEDNWFPYIGKVDNEEYSAMLDYLAKKHEVFKAKASKAKNTADKAKDKADKVDGMLEFIAGLIANEIPDDDIRDAFKKFKTVLDKHED